MDQRKFDKYWVYLGALLVIPFLMDYIKIPDLGLTVLSILFGGLLTIYLILPTVQHFKQFEFIVKSGHIKDMMNYLKVPIYLSLTLILMDFVRNIINVPIAQIVLLIYNSIYLALWGIFILSLFRIIILLPKILINQGRNHND